jgi:cobalt-zinc-cadmium efflux system protein
VNENQQIEGTGRHPDGGHAHAHGGKRLGLAAGANAAFAVVQIFVGLAIGSVVVLADAAHQTVDALGLVTAWIALRIARRPASDDWSYGLGKADALGGFVSALLLIGSVVWIVVESIQRLVTPEPVDGGGVIVIGLVAIAVNGVGVVLVGHGHGDEAISLRAARLHLLADLAGSVVVVATGVLLVATDAAWLDPTASLVVSIAVLWSTWNLLRSATDVLLDRSPSGISAVALAGELRSHPDVDAAHHIHIRSLGGGRHAASAHIVVDGSTSAHRSQEISDELSVGVAATLGIDHLTLQLECLHACPDPDLPAARHRPR